MQYSLRGPSIYALLILFLSLLVVHYMYDRSSLFVLSLLIILSIGNRLYHSAIYYYSKPFLFVLLYYLLSCYSRNFLFSMPQFKPFYWINLISWAFAILSFLTWYHQAISFPHLLRIKLSRALMLFYF